MTKDANSRGLDEILARIDAVQDAEQQRLVDEMVALRVRLALVEREQAALRRSKMSPAEKSRFIRAHGIEAYQRLPMK
jgi:hypothetical protein